MRDYTDKLTVQTAVQKQRRIKMYFVGIDISKFKHDCFIVDNNGKVIVSSWSFANDQEGFLLL